MDASAGATLSAVVARLVPGDPESPGALEAGVPEFVEQELRGTFAAEEDAVVAGLRSLDAGARATHERAFHELEPEHQDELLRVVETDPFFEMLLQLTIDGFLGDPRHGGNRDRLGWQVVGYPGVLMSPTEEQQRIGTVIGPVGVTVEQWRADR